MTCLTFVRPDPGIKYKMLSGSVMILLLKPFYLWFKASEKQQCSGVFDGLYSSLSFYLKGLHLK